MPPTRDSGRAVYRRVAQRPHIDWPAYDSTLLYDRTSLAGLESDIPTVSETWFDHDNHDSVEDVLGQAEKITDHVSRIVFPAFSLDRGDGCEIHENACWGLQMYLGLRERLAANEGARSFVYESTRERTPLGHAHRSHIRDLSIEQIREMYQQAITRPLNEVAETEQFFRA